MELLSTVVLEKDLVGLGLKRGDIGAVVEVYERGGLEVEFAIALGKTEALLTLTRSDVRVAADKDILTVRS